MSGDCHTIGFCPGPFWDVDLTWNTDSPDFTPCFHQTVLVYAPIVVGLVVALIELPSLRKKRFK